MITREELLALAGSSAYPVMDLSLGVPADPSPEVPTGRPAAGYPPSPGTAALRSAAQDYLERRFGVEAGAVAACAGLKEFIGSLPLFLRRLRPAVRDTVLIPALGYPSYAFGAELAGLRVHRVPCDDTFRMRLDLLPAGLPERTLLLWVNSPGNPTGALEDLAVIAAWGRAHGVVVASDEAYAETTWSGPPASILQQGPAGVLGLHSVSKRSNAPGLRAGFYAGDPELVAGLVGLRREAGLMVSATAQDAAARLFADDTHAGRQRERNRGRVGALVAALHRYGFACAVPDGGLFAWVATPDGDEFARRAATEAGLVIRPGAEYGPAGIAHARIAAVHDDVAPRLAVLSNHLTRSSSADR